MSASDEINAKLDWCIEALKYLLKQAESPQPEDEGEDAWLDDTFDADLAEAAAAVIPGTGGGCPHVNTAIMAGHVICKQCNSDLGCSHNQQANVNGRIVCANCGEVLGQSGVVGRDPGAPMPGSQTREASSKNPGTPLVPY